VTGYRTLLVEKRGAVEWLTLNRPERLNTLTGTMVHELVGYLQSKLTDLDTRIIVMRGAGRASVPGSTSRNASTAAIPRRSWPASPSSPTSCR
jgi:enoyl-CoA hydratase/carnithine racemase